MSCPRGALLFIAKIFEAVLNESRSVYELVKQSFSQNLLLRVCGDRRRFYPHPSRDGADADLRMRVREVVAERGYKFGKLPAHRGLVHVLPYYPRFPFFRPPLVCLAAFLWKERGVADGREVPLRRTP